MMQGMDIGVGLLVLMNGLGFALMGLDKRKAQRKAWRTPESTFFLVALLGGSIGVWLGMRFFRHKTLHKTFTIGIPLILLLQVGFALLMVFFYRS